METNPLNLSFFWHMHQPDYRGSDGVMRMPWVFLHAIKDYYEMPWLLSEHPNLKATFNLSASLIEQLRLYREPLKFDYFLSLWMMPPSQLEDSQRQWVIKIITAMQFETMVRPIERYAELYYHTSFSDEELIDLEVVFILAWCGNYLRLHNALVKALLLKGRGFDAEDKRGLLSTLGSFVQDILPFYGSLQDKGVVSVSTTPYFHPILPVLLDMQNAKYANAATDLPEGAFSLRDDANEHVTRSIELYQKTFGCAPKGFWPAEGAVDEKSLRIYKDHAIKWIATDEAILYKSLQQETASLRYKPYIFDGVSIAFRDHGLSDLIGFEYRHRSGADASHHFMKELEQIAKSNLNPSVFVIVDGENAWEFYDNNGLDFFTSLYHELSVSSWCKTLTMDEVSMLRDQDTLKHLAPGSWIHGTFDTWVGHREKNRAWELIFRTQRDVAAATIKDDVKEAISYHLLASECSDWFWWYGEDHNTDFAAEFDALFREHLIHVYTLLGQPIPQDLFIPIISKESQKPAWIKPSNTISPKVNGEKSTFFDWMGSGSVDEGKIFGAMDRVRGPVDTLYYGFDQDCLYVACEGNISDAGIKVEVLIDESKTTLSIEPYKIDNRLEFSLPRSSFGKLKSVHLRFELISEGKTVQSLPGFGPLKIDMSENFATDWYL